MKPKKTEPIEPEPEGGHGATTYPSPHARAPKPPRQPARLDVAEGRQVDRFDPPDPLDVDKAPPDYVKSADTMERELSPDDRERLRYVLRLQSTTLPDVLEAIGARWPSESPEVHKAYGHSRNAYVQGEGRSAVQDLLASYNPPERDDRPVPVGPATLDPTGKVGTPLPGSDKGKPTLTVASTPLSPIVTAKPTPAIVAAIRSAVKTTKPTGNAGTVVLTGRTTPKPTEPELDYGAIARDLESELEPDELARWRRCVATATTPLPEILRDRGAKWESESPEVRRSYGDSQAQYVAEHGRAYIAAAIGPAPKPAPQPVAMPGGAMTLTTGAIVKPAKVKNPVCHLNTGPLFTTDPTAKPKGP